MSGASRLGEASGAARVGAVRHRPKAPTVTPAPEPPAGRSLGEGLGSISQAARDGEKGHGVANARLVFLQSAPSLTMDPGSRLRGCDPVSLGRDDISKRRLLRRRLDLFAVLGGGLQGFGVRRCLTLGQPGTVLLLG